MYKKVTPQLPFPSTYKNPLCREVGGDLFFYGDADDPDQLDTNAINVKLARNICKNCDHVVECAEWGVHHEQFGVWGGLSPVELDDARRKRNISIESIRYSVD